ncbi:hypothetical protein EI94DRAFT_1817032 [Lactarius quietus]|nr:hypothetical protein EI94DRAFT_1817032 [Lactarius quietus]
MTGSACLPSLSPAAGCEFGTHNPPASSYRNLTSLVQKHLTSDDLFIDGFVACTFTSGDAANYFALLFRDRRFIQQFGVVYHQGAWYITRNVNQVQGASPGVDTPLLDHSIEETYGTVVPQRRWFPVDQMDFQRHVVEAVLQLPVFFVNRDGSIGFSLSDILRGCDRDLRNRNAFAPLGGRVTTHVRILWPGYRDWKRQIATRDDTRDRNPITVARFMRHVGTSVDKFFKECMSNDIASTDRRWQIGMHGINQSHVKVIGVVHVSAGSWMPIIQINGYVIYCNGT